MDKLQPHPLANIFPMIADDAYPDFKADIETHGLADQIVLLDGRILDGRNRYRALCDLGWEHHDHHYVAFGEMVKEKGLNMSPLDYVVSKNMARRHLSESQRSMSAARAATMRQGERNDIDPLPMDPEPSANLRKVSAGEAADMFAVSERSVNSANTILKQGIKELQGLVDQGQVVVSVAEEIARMPEEDQREIIADNTPSQLKGAAKKAARQRKQKALAEKQKALPVKKYGVIYADPEWKFITRSEAGMDRAADNHYPTSKLDEIMARRVADIAADDCVLFMWATVPMLIEAICVAEAWGFCRLERDDISGHLKPAKKVSRYVTNWDWVKHKISTGYWGRNQHEHLLVFTKGNPIAPAMGTQPASAIMAEMPIEGAPDALSPNANEAIVVADLARDHSEKPDIFRDWITRLFPDAPKIELNARTAGEGWDVWGNEAPETEADPNTVPKPKRKTNQGEEIQKEWARRDAKKLVELKAIGRDLPEDEAGLLAAYQNAIVDFDRSVRNGIDSDARRARGRMLAVQLACNGWERMGCAVNEMWKRIDAAASKRDPGDNSLPLFGQSSAFIAEHEGVRAIVSVKGYSEDGKQADIDLHAIDAGAEFVSGSGFLSVGSQPIIGREMADIGTEAIAYGIKYSTNKKFNSYAAGLKVPEELYQLLDDGTVTPADTGESDDTAGDNDVSGDADWPPSPAVTYDGKHTDETDAVIRKGYELKKPIVEICDALGIPHDKKGIIKGRASRNGWTDKGRIAENNKARAKR